MSEERQQLRLNEDLLRACKYVQFERAQRLLEEGANVDYVNEQDKISPLLAAMENTQKDIKTLDRPSDETGRRKADLAMFLLEKGASAGLCCNGMSPLSVASMYPTRDFIPVVERLLGDSSVDIHHRDNGGRTVLMNATRGGVTQVFEMLLEKFREVDETDKTLKTALIHACIQDNLNIIKLLVRRGANLEARDEAGASPFMTACKFGRIRVLRYLKKKGASFKARPDGWTPIMSACLGLWFDNTYDFLTRECEADINVPANDGTNAVHAACQGGSMKTLQRVLDLGMKPNAVADDGWTSLMSAAYVGSHEIVRFLLRNKEEFLIEINATTNKGMTALMFAASRGHVQVVETLLRFGADPDLQNDKGKNALALARYPKISSLLRRRDH